MDNAPALYSGIRELAPQGSHDREGQIIITQHQPLPLTVLGMFRARRSDGDAGMMLVLPLTEGLLRQAIANERDRVTAELCDYPQFIARVLERPAKAWALVEAGEPVVAFGLMQIWPGRAEVWQLTSAKARPRQLVKAARIAVQILDSHQRDPAFRRVEMFVHCHCSWAVSFINALGFDRKCRMDKWDPRGRDVWLCERIREAA
jgi:hypothetical protein